MHWSINQKKTQKNWSVDCGIWTHADYSNSALSYRLRPLGQVHHLMKEGCLTLTIWMGGNERLVAKTKSAARTKARTRASDVRLWRVQFCAVEFHGRALHSKHLHVVIPLFFFFVYIVIFFFFALLQCNNNKHNVSRLPAMLQLWTFHRVSIKIYKAASTLRIYCAWLPLVSSLLFPLYSRAFSEYKTYHEVLDEIKRRVDYLGA